MDSYKARRIFISSMKLGSGQSVGHTHLWLKFRESAFYRAIDLTAPSFTDPAERTKESGKDASSVFLELLVHNVPFVRMLVKVDEEPFFRFQNVVALLSAKSQGSPSDPAE